MLGNRQQSAVVEIRLWGIPTAVAGNGEKGQKTGIFKLGDEIINTQALETRILLTNILNKWYARGHLRFRSPMTPIDAGAKSQGAGQLRSDLANGAR